jgi:hypothetical protein
MSKTSEDPLNSREKQMKIYRVGFWTIIDTIRIHHPSRKIYRLLPRFLLVF